MQIGFALSPSNPLLSVLSEVAETAEQALASAMTGATDGAFFDFTQATSDGTTYSAPDLSAAGSDATQEFSTQIPGVDATLGAIMDATANDNAIYKSVPAQNITFVMALRKDPADARGCFIPNGNSRYQDGLTTALSGSGVTVDGAAVATNDALHDALNDGAEHIVVWRSFPWAGGGLGIGRSSDSITGSIRRAVFIPDTQVSDLADARAKAVTWVTDTGN